MIIYCFSFEMIRVIFCVYIIFDEDVVLYVFLFVNLLRDKCWMIVKKYIKVDGNMFNVN